jgi:hypothetical protein
MQAVVHAVLARLHFNSVMPLTRMTTILASWTDVTYKPHMIEVRQTTVFREWLEHLADRRARERIAQRIVRLQAGLMGDVKPLGDGLSEIRID